MRRSGGSVSGSNRNTSAQQIAPYAARIQKMQRQSANASTALPMVGARIGAAPITSERRDSSTAAAWPSARSRTMARGITIPADAPTAATARNAESQPMDGASEQPRQATV